MDKTLQQIKNEYAKELGLLPGERHYYEWMALMGTVDINEIAKRYVEECCKATQEKIAEKFETWPARLFYRSKKENEILNPSNIVLL